MKKIILIGLLTTIIWFTNADFWPRWNWTYTFTVWEPEVLWEYTYVFDNKGNLNTNWSKVAYKTYIATNDNSYYVQYARHNGKMYYWNYSAVQQNYNQWYIDKWCINPNINQCADDKPWNYNKTTEEVIQNIWTIENVIFWQESTARNRAYSNRWIKLCFYDNYNYYCANCAKSACISWLTGENLNLTYSQVESFNWSNSPIKIAWYDPIWQCPTLAQVEKTYWLQKEVCYAWFDLNSIYMSWRNDIITPWTWATIIETRQTTSWSMNIQTRYDTYREYYKNRNNDIRPFEWRYTALLWTQIARQMYGKNKTSFQILNYCNIALYEWDKEHTTTCTATTGSFQLPIEQAKPTTNDIIESIIATQPEIITPWTWTVFKQILWEQGDREIRESFKSIYWKLTQLFHFRQGKNWILPVYITRIILIIVLLKIFRK